MTDRLNILGIDVSAMDIPRTVDQFDAWIAARDRQYVCVRDVHGVMQAVRDPAIRTAHLNAGLVVPDGMPLVWLLKRAGYAAGRCYGPDLMLETFRRSETTGHRHFLYGAVPATLELLQANLHRRFPGAVIAGAYAPPFRPAGASETAEVIAAINEAKPDIIWVGLSTPKQELWMTNHRALIEAPVMVGVGAAFDFHASLVRQAPPLLQKIGMEWAFRMAMEPRRLGWRYLRNNPAFVALIVAQSLGLRRF